MQKVLICSHDTYQIASYENRVNSYLEGGWTVKDVKLETVRETNDNSRTVIIFILEK